MKRANRNPSSRPFRLLMKAALLAAPAASLHAESNFPPDVPVSVDVCMTCHGGYGQGSEVVGGPKLAGMEPWYLKNQLLAFRQGYRGVEAEYIPGFEMRATAEAMSEAEIEAVVAEIAAWPDVPATPLLDGDASAGAQPYGLCAACHGANAEGNEALGAPALAGRSDWYLRRQLELFSKGWRGANENDLPGRQMRAAMATLADEGAWNDVLAYIQTLGAPQSESASAVEDTGGIDRQGEGRILVSTIRIPADAETLYLSGAGASPLPDGGWGDMEQQTIDIFEKFKTLLEAQHWSMSDIVQVRVFAIAGNDGVLDFEGFNRGYLKFFGTAENPLKPVRTFVQVADLVREGWLVEVEVRAARVPGKG